MDILSVNLNHDLFWGLIINLLGKLQNIPTVLCSKKRGNIFKCRIYAWFILINLCIDFSFSVVNHQKGKIVYVHLYPVVDYVHIVGLNTRICVGLKTLPNLNFKIKFQTQISNSNFKLKLEFQN